MIYKNYPYYKSSCTVTIALNLSQFKRYKVIE